MPYASNKAADQPEHIRSLISAFLVRCLDSYNTSTCYSRNFKTLASHCSWAVRFEFSLVTNPEDRLSRDEARVDLQYTSSVDSQRLHKKECSWRSQFHIQRLFVSRNATHSKYRIIRKPRSIWKSSRDLYWFAVGLGDYSWSRINAHLMFSLFPENRKSTPLVFSGKKLLKNVTLQVLNFISVS